MTTLIIFKQEVIGCAACPFNHYEGAENCTHPVQGQTAIPCPPNIPNEHLDPGKGAPDWCPLQMNEVLVAWEGA